MPKYKILTFDSGGIRGLLSVLVIEHLDNKIPGWRNDADLIAGTSTGGIIALGLANGTEISRIKQFYYDKSDMIFDKSYLRGIKKFVEADYDNRQLKRMIKSVFGNRLLGELGKNVLIPAFDLDNDDVDPEKRQWKPKFFHNMPGRDNDGELKIADVAMYTTAAPGIFPSVDGFIDGCVVAVNPAMSALAQTQDNRCCTNPPDLSDIVMLSVGTGTIASWIGGSRLDWGYAQWAKHIMRIMLDGSSEVTDYQCRQLLKERYHRVDYRFRTDEWIQVDDHSKKDKIVDIVNNRMGSCIDEASEWIRTHWL